MSKKRIDTMDPEALSRPENHVHRGQGMSLVEMVKKAGGCWYCTRRDPNTEMFGRALCGKVITATFNEKGCTFTPDDERLYDRGNTK